MFQFRKLAWYVAASLLIAPITASALDLTSARPVPNGDPAMDAAMKRARAGTEDFLAKLANPPKGTSNYAVKVAILDEGDSYIVGNNPRDAEFFWLVDIQPNGDDGFTAKLANQPEQVKNVKAGQQISFKKGQIFDWSYMDNGKLKGNYSACAILISGAPEDLHQFETTYGTTCDRQLTN